MKKFIRSKILLACIVIAAVFLRIWQLDKVPTGISDDELIFLINAKAVFLTGKDIAGNWSPFSLTTITGEFPQAELPYLIMSPFVGLLGFSLFLSKLPYAIISVLSGGLLYLITRKLVGKHEALVVGIVAAFNPWGIILGRTAYEAPLAIFFYLLAFYILLITRGWKILLAFIPLFLAFYSYMATKLIFVPFVITLSAYCWFFLQKKQYLKQYLVLCGICLYLFFTFVFTVQSQPAGSRVSEILSPTNPAIEKTVDAERQLSIQTPLTEAYSNKLVVWGKEAIGKYLKVFSTEDIFVTGEGRSPFSLWYHGYFYYLDAVFLLIGFFILFKKKRSAWSVFTALLLIAPIPAVASNSTSGFAALRAGLLCQIFIIFIGLGIWYILALWKNLHYKIAVCCLLILLYGIHLFNFVNIYFFRNPIYNSEAYNLSSRILSNYIVLAERNNTNVVFVSNNPRINFYHYLFETNNYTAKNATAVRKLLKNNTLQINNVSFIKCLRGIKVPPNQTLIVSAEAICEYVDTEKFGNKLSISRLSDGSNLFFILNDTLCNNHALRRSPSAIAFSDLGVEQLPEKQFCESYITDPKSTL